ncbi:hypothetical protein HG530_005423 [Fusarium avenaceum]|nr:hypothetical protein HG530_005423 [Fusarium avenaceum]
MWPTRRLVGSDLLLGALDNLLDLLFGAVNKRSLATGSSGVGGSLLLLLLLGLGVDGGLHVEDVIAVNLDLVLVGNGETEESKGLVDGDIGLGRLAAEKGRAAGQVVVEGLKDGRLVLGGLETLRGGEPLLDLSLLGGSVGLGSERGHSEDFKRAERREASSGLAEDTEG